MRKGIIFWTLSFIFVFLACEADDKVKPNDEEIEEECDKTKSDCCPLGWIGADCKTPDRVRIPATGDSTTFTMGCPDSDAWCRDNEKPAQQVTLTAYKIDRYLVTTASYKRCVDEGQCTEARTEIGCNYSQPIKKDNKNLPINCINWEQARKYCEWAGGRLPTEAEWERAAKGETHRRYPWGDDCPASWNETHCSAEEWIPETAKANGYDSLCHDDYSASSPVNAFSAGQSPEGLYDMVGNLLEWTSDWSFREYTSDAVTDPVGPEEGSLRVIRGASWAASDCAAMRVSNRAEAKPNMSIANFIGVRCVAPAD